MSQTSTDPAGSDTFELELTAMAHGGSAIGRHAGRAIFVPYSIPGERITARITDDRGRFAHAEGVTLLEPAESRVYPRCPHFGPGRCGGCQWQHIEYDAQLAFKQQTARDQLMRIGGVKDPLVHPTLASPDEWAYRSHITFHLTSDGQLGFVATDDQHIVPVEVCHIVRPPLASLLETLEIDLAANPNLARVRLQVGSAPEDLLIAFSTTDDEVPFIEVDLPVAVSFLSSDDDPQNLIGGGCVHYMVGGRLFRVTAGSFFQVNLPQAGKLVELVMSKLDVNPQDHVLDLFSGVGLFSAFLAERARRVTCVEGFGPAVADADHNLAGFDNIDLIEGGVEDVLPELDERPSAVVLDPPRTGLLPEAVDALVELAPARIAYVSCDPATLARDVKRMITGGYRLIEVQPVDMFPQTYHIESVALLAR